MTSEHSESVEALKRRVDELEYSVGLLAREALMSFTGYTNSPRKAALYALAGKAPAKGSRS